ncbi:MAG: cation:proton antiporter [Anaerolineales bacterium]
MEIYWVIIAFIAGAAAQAIRLPTLVGYILSGLVLAALGVTSGDFIVAVGDFGIMMLLFTVGLHIRVQNIIQPEVLGTGGVHLLVSMMMYGALGVAFGIPLSVALMLGLALGFSSTVLTAKTLESRDELDAYHGRVAMGILIIQDVVAIGLLALTGTETPQPWALGLLALPLLRPIIFRILDYTGKEEMILLFGLVLALGIGELFYLSGLSAKLGALLAGVLLADHPQADNLYDKFWALKEVFLVGFFLQVGLVGVPDMTGVLFTLMLLALLPVKAALFFALMLRFNLRARTGFVGSLTLAAYSEFALIVAAAAVEGGLIDETWLTTLALAVALSFAVNAPLNRLVNPLWERLEPRLGPLERDAEHPDHQPRSLGGAHFLVVGMGQVGTAAYDYLVEHGQRPIGLDSDPAKIERHLKMGRRVLFGESQDSELLQNLDLANIHAVILAVPSLPAKIDACDMLRENNFTGQINALVREQDADNLKRLEAAGITASMLPLVQAGRELGELSLHQAQKQLNKAVGGAA